jgi:hypothetical protein
MAMQILPLLKAVTFSGLGIPNNHYLLSKNFLRVSIWGTLGSGGTALVSFVFSRFLMQEGPWKGFASHVFEANLASCGTFAIAATYCSYKITNQTMSPDLFKTLNGRVSLFATGSAWVGLIGITAAWASQFITSNTQGNSLAEHLFYPLLGLGTAGWILRIFFNTQIVKLANSRLATASKI